MTLARPRTGRALVEAAVVVALYLARGLARGDDAVAERHADAIAGLERHLHVFGEAAVQRAAGTWPAAHTCRCTALPAPSHPPRPARKAPSARHASHPPRRAPSAR